jgi:acetyl-CoA acetyltransferase
VRSSWPEAWNPCLNPFVFAKSETSFSRDLKVFDSTIGARFPNPAIEKQFGDDTMPKTGDNVAVEYGVTREDADRFAAASQARYEAAKQASFFAGEIVGVEVSQGRKLFQNWWKSMSIHVQVQILLPCKAQAFI